LPPTRKKPAAAKSAPARTQKSSQPRPPIRREAGAAACLVVGLLTVLAIYFSVSALFLDMFRALAFGLLGGGGYALPVLLLLASGLLAFHRGRPVRLRLACLAAWALSISAFVHMMMDCDCEESFHTPNILWIRGRDGNGGGVLGGFLNWLLEATISRPGTIILLLLVLAASALILLRVTPARILEYIRKPREAYEPEEPEETPVAVVPPKPVRKNQAIDIPLDSPPKRPEPLPLPVVEPVPVPAAVETPPPEPPEPKTTHEPGGDSGVLPEGFIPVENLKTMSPVTVDKPGDGDDDPPFAVQPTRPIQDPPPYIPPPLSLLTAPGIVGTAGADSAEELRANRDRLVKTITDFGITAKVLGITRGPTVARYELELESGTKLSRLVGLSDDIALTLGTSGVRIAPVEGRAAVVGIEVPNRLKHTVYLRDVLESPAFKGRKSSLCFAIGRDIGGEDIVGDIGRLTHLLIAGTTGSGKSVCVNSLIVSILYGAAPDEVQLIMIDPKMVELKPFSDIPHLLVPVVTDPKEAASALNKMVYEMEKRYSMFMKRGVKDIVTYNEAVTTRGVEGEKPLPRIVIIVDELADLMMSAAKEVEDSVVRIAQKARAAGLHLVIATQRPSADVITGLMKANIPSRIAFTVASSLESRIILDSMGAEKLVGRGDMLYSPVGAMKPQRIQGCLITEREIEDVVAAVKQNAAQPEYDRELMDEIKRGAELVGAKGSGAKPSAAIPADGDDDDALLPSAVEIVLETGQASASMLQRRLKLGYARASRLVDQMEEKGVVGPFEGSKPRQILITKQEWEERQA